LLKGVSEDGFVFLFQCRQPEGCSAGRQRAGCPVLSLEELAAAGESVGQGGAGFETRKPTLTSRPGPRTVRSGRVGVRAVAADGGAVRAGEADRAVCSGSSGLGTTPASVPMEGLAHRADPGSSSGATGLSGCTTGSEFIRADSNARWMTRRLYPSGGEAPGWRACRHVAGLRDDELQVD